MGIQRRPPPSGPLIRMKSRPRRGPVDGKAVPVLGPPSPLRGGGTEARRGYSGFRCAGRERIHPNPATAAEGGAGGKGWLVHGQARPVTVAGQRRICTGLPPAGGPPTASPCPVGQAPRLRRRVRSTPGNPPPHARYGILSATMVLHVVFATKAAGSPFWPGVAPLVGLASTGSAGRPRSSARAPPLPEARRGTAEPRRRGRPPQPAAGPHPRLPRRVPPGPYQWASDHTHVPTGGQGAPTRPIRPSMTALKGWGSCWT